MSVRIISDSTADYPEEIREKVTVIPLTIRFGDKEYVDGVTITHTEFYHKLETESVLPTTSQATPDTFSKYFAQAVEAGDSVVVITIASELSGTCQSAMIAAANYPGKVFVVDSRNVTIGAGVLVSYAVKMAEAGKSAEEIADCLMNERKNVRVMAVLDTLEYLKRGGRVSKTVAFAGGILNIKPVACVVDGEIKVIGKARGTKQGVEVLLKEIEKAGGVDDTRPACLGYTGVSGQLLDAFCEECKARKNPIAELPKTGIGSVVGTHAGPDAYAVAFFLKQ